jgi:hypothetical protein
MVQCCSWERSLVNRDALSTWKAPGRPSACRYASLSVGSLLMGCVTARGLWDCCCCGSCRDCRGLIVARSPGQEQMFDLPMARVGNLTGFSQTANTLNVTNCILSKAILQKLLVTQWKERLAAFHRTRRFISVSTRSRHWFVPTVRWIQRKLFYPIR